jgi:hypothetical protein
LHVLEKGRGDPLWVIYSFAQFCPQWRMVLSFAPSVHVSTHSMMLPVSVRSMVVDSSLSSGTKRGLKTRPLVGAACGTQ